MPFNLIFADSDQEKAESDLSPDKSLSYTKYGIPLSDVNPYPPDVVLRNKIEQYSKENVYSEASDYEYFRDLWIYIYDDLLELYEVRYPDRDSNYYIGILRTYREKLRQNIALVRTHGASIPEF